MTIPDAQLRLRAGGASPGRGTGVENDRAWVMERMDARNLADLIRKVLLMQRSG
jgi:hypothetical protein